MTRNRVDERVAENHNPMTWVRVKPAQARRGKRAMPVTQFKVTYKLDCGEIIIRHRESDHSTVMDAIIDTEQKLKDRWAVRSRAARMAKLTPDQRKLVTSLLPS